MRYSIVYSSRTGNTKLLADTIKAALPPEDCIYCGESSPEALAADRIYVGFWTDKGHCDSQTADFLEAVTDQEIFLFGTAGFGGAPDYFNTILARTQKKLPRSAQLVGSYMCQGKMPMSVRERYEKMKKSPVPIPRMDEMLANFDRALSHPDAADLSALREQVAAL